MVSLHIYDFDGTLFRSPDKPSWWPKATYWIKHPASLDVPCVPEKPGKAYWIGTTVAAARKSIADPDVVTALITGRIDNSFARYRVPELLKQQGLNFDSVHLSTSTDTAGFKMTVMREIMNRHKVDAVQIWEDHATNLGKFVKMIDDQGITVMGHLVNSSRQPCTAPEFDTRVARIAQRYTHWVMASTPRFAAGTAQDITDNIRPYAQAMKDLVAVINKARGQGFAGDNYHTRSWANIPWIQVLQTGAKIVNGILSTRSIPRRHAKGLEMAYRLLVMSRRMPRDVYKWWAKNEKRLHFVLKAALDWPEKVEGGDELFKVGAFRIHNTVGITGPELKSLKDAIAKVERAVKKAPVPGFAKVLYGDIHVVSRITEAHHAAWYYPQDDSLYLRQGKKTGMDEVQSMVHELGHRFWRKMAPKKRKSAWIKHHAYMEVKDVEVKLPSVGEAIPFMHIPGVKSAPVVTGDDGTTLFFDVVKKGVKETYSMSRAQMARSFKEQARMTQVFPTPYSTKNYEEHFCEALSLLALGKLPPEHAKPFKAIWSSGSRMATQHILGSPTVHLSPDWYDLPRGISKTGLWVVAETLKLNGLHQVKIHSRGHADGGDPPEGLSESGMATWDSAVDQAINAAESFEKHKMDRGLNLRFRQTWARATFEMDSRKLRWASNWHKKAWMSLTPLERGHMVYRQMADRDGNPSQAAWALGAYLKS